MNPRTDPVTPVKQQVPVAAAKVNARPWSRIRIAQTAGLVAGAAVTVWLVRRLMLGSNWGAYDTWTVLTAAMAAMACAVPGVFLVVRRQSMLGDALSHAMLPGIVIAFLAAHAARQAGWITPDAYDAWRHGTMFAGALLLGILAALLTEWVQKLGRVEASAALGVVFSTLFALGLLLLRLKADEVDLDPDCVLYGLVETAVLDTFPGTSIPRAAAANAAVLLLNLLLVVLFFKELRISAFDPGLATTMGIHAHVMHYALTAITAATLVSAFESVGSILVIAMLIAPPATAHLLTDRLDRMIAISLLVAAASAFLGHLLAISVPPAIFGALGYPEVADTSTAGMMAVAAGLLFVLAALCGPRYGVMSKLVDQIRLGLMIVGEDVLGLLYRREEAGAETLSSAQLLALLGGRPWQTRLAVRQLTAAGEITRVAAGLQLTNSGREKAQRLVRAHRLWESYMAKHFDVPDDHLHEAAHWAEHFIGPELREELAAELEDTHADPHGREIPPESSPPS